MRTLIALVDAPADLGNVKASIAGKPEAHPLTILCLAGEGKSAKDFRQTLAELGTCDIELISGAEYVSRGASAARAEFVSFLAEWPDKPLLDGKSFKRLFTHEGDLSLWWLTELSEKNVDLRPTFNLLCKVEALRLVVKEHRFERALVLTKDRDLHDVMEQVLLAAGIEVLPPGRWSTVPREKTIGRHLLDRLRFTYHILKRAAALKALSLLSPRSFAPRITDPHGVAFVTWFPSLWTRNQRGRLVDRYFVDIPTRVRATGRKAVCLCAYDGGRSHLKDLVDFNERSDVPLAPLDGYVGIRRLLALCLNPMPIVRYLYLERFHRPFRESFAYKEWNLFPLVYDDFRSSFVGPRMLASILWAEAIREFLKWNKVSTLVTTLEFHGWERALCYGARKADDGVFLVGVQPGVVTEMRLNYRFGPGEIAQDEEQKPDFIEHLPTHDRFLVHGDTARRILRESGIPEVRIRKVGVFRLDDLAALSGRGNGEGARGLLFPQASRSKKVLLVAGSVQHSECLALFERCVEAATLRSDVFVIFKPHPNCPISDEIHDCAKRHGLRDYAVSGANVHDLIEASDAVVATYSTVGLEAVAMNRPVINVVLEDRLDLSPFSEVPVAVRAGSSQEIAAALDSVLNGGTVCGDHDKLRARFIEEHFFRLDGHAKDRCMEILEEAWTR